jgi:hypothetical protein
MFNKQRSEDKMKISKIVTGLAILTFAGSVSALPYNPGRPLSANFNTGSGSEDSLQTILNDNFNNDSGDVEINAYTDQSNVAAWTKTDASASKAYLVDILTGGAGNLGIYSLSTGSEYTFNLGGVLNSYTSGDRAVIEINTAGDLFVNTTLAVSGFGNSFGFYWENGSNKFYTEDDKNGGDARALTYLVDAGTDWEVGGWSGTTNGNDDWVLAFEDSTDNDYQDAVFFISDISAVPEPSILALFGLGLAGLGFAARKKAQA